MINSSKKRIVVGMSGGVDSSVAAALLKKQNYDVVGVFLKFWTDPLCTGKCRENTCCNQEALLQARKVASILDIPFYVLDVSEEFKKLIVDYYIDEYQNGRTPNPCVECNKFIKFGWLLNKAKELGAEFIATGHYAKVECSFPVSQKDVRFFHGAQASGKRLRPTFCDSAHSHYDQLKTENLPAGRHGCKLLTPQDKTKDQTYFLWRLDQNQLKHIIFPLSGYQKPEVRELARKFKLPVAEKKESQGICFIPDGDNVGFLSRYIKKLIVPGKIVDINNNVLGEHKGLGYYTIGQRHGLEGIQLNRSIGNRLTSIATSNGYRQSAEKRKTNNLTNNVKRTANDESQSSGFPKAYVLKLNIDKNELVVGEEKDLYQKELVAEKVNWINSRYTLQVTRYTNCEAKIRYGHPAEKCKISFDLTQDRQNSNNKYQIKVTFEKPQRAITPGQSVVFYLPREVSAKWGQENEIIGGGIIK